MDINIVTNNNEMLSMPLADYNTLNVRTMINKNDNPNSILIISIIFILILVIYYIYTSFVKLNFSGEWYDGNKILHVSHNTYTDKITIKNSRLTGTIRGNAIYLHNYSISDKVIIGTLMNKKIYWVNTTEIWQRPTYAS